MHNIKQQIELPCEMISPGTVISNVCHYQVGSDEQTAVYTIPEKQIKVELERFHKAREKSKQDLKEIIDKIEKSLTPKEAGIFDTHILLLDDNQIIDKISKMVTTDKINIEHAVKDVFEEFENLFASMDDHYLQERKNDFKELKIRLLSHLTGIEGRFKCDVHCDIGKSRIILAKELTTSMISLINEHKVVGFITEMGNHNSHAAILARAAGIPYVSNVPQIYDISCGTPVIIDTDKNKVFFYPERKILDSYRSIIRVKDKLENDGKVKGPVIPVSKDIGLEIYANIMTPQEIHYIHKYNLAGAGLVRTEFLFIDANTFPTFEEQKNTYGDLVKNADGKPLTFRQFDFGGDKKIKSLAFHQEENPLLGLRGIRYLLKKEKMLKDQLRALYEAGRFGPIRILFPMISHEMQLDQVLKAAEEVRTEFGYENSIPLGMMFELPSVFVDPSRFLKKIDFVSIGTNDLVQYLFGIDRNNPRVEFLYTQDNDLVILLIEQLVKSAEAHKVDLSLCGEINLKTTFLERIIKAGIRKISIAPVGFLSLYSNLKGRK